MAKKLGKNNRNIIDEYSISNVLPIMEKIYPNFLGAILVINISISLTMFFLSKGIFSTIYYGILSTIYFMGILTSGTMSAVVALFILIILILILLIKLVRSLTSLTIL